MATWSFTVLGYYAAEELKNQGHDTSKESFHQGNNYINVFYFLWICYLKRIPIKMVVYLPIKYFERIICSAQLCVYFPFIADAALSDT